MSNDLLIYVPTMETLISIREGTGDNLLPEDIEEGYEDYLMYDCYDVTEADYGECLEPDGGMLMYKELIQEKFDKLSETVPDVMMDVFETSDLEYIILKGE